MATPGQMTAMGVTGTNGLLAGSVADMTGTRLSGATITLTSRNGATYTVFYTGNGSSTDANGGFRVPNVQPGDIVKVEATRAGYTFTPFYMDCFASSITEKGFFGTSVSEVLYASFPGSGIWKWDGSAWTQTTPNTPEHMVN